MVRFKKIECETMADTRKYNVATVAQAIGRSEGSISAYFSNRDTSTKGGLTIDQIAEVLEAPIRGKTINWGHVEEIRQRLHDEKGYLIEID